jgi:hypothetical protein
MEIFSWEQRFVGIFCPETATVAPVDVIWVQKRGDDTDRRMLPFGVLPQEPLFENE